LGQGEKVRCSMTAFRMLFARLNRKPNHVLQYLISRLSGKQNSLP